MTDNPDGAALLEEARRTLLEVLLPLLPPERRYDGLMVANAMAIAAREAAQGDAALREVVQQLSALFPAALQRGSRAHLRELEARLAGEIRAGLCDAPGVRRDAVSDYLRRLGHRPRSREQSEGPSVGALRAPQEINAWTKSEPRMVSRLRGMDGRRIERRFGIVRKRAGVSGRTDQRAPITNELLESSIDCWLEVAAVAGAASTTMQSME
jgi:hypothetical protein